MSESEAVDTTPKATEDWIVFRKEDNRKTQAGLIIPETAGDVYAIVVSVGDRVASVSPGDRIMLCAGPTDIGTFAWMGNDYGVARKKFVACKLPGDSGVVLADRPLVSLS